ncbi:helix-turn-helix domain-containing protein [Streptomyces sp. NPDC060048]|uniref:helix-turn-helix domain-containing protein n=1 Tax=unclassified Streptomyces TaxID=2593676 RepID=UPI003673A1ED
MEHEGRPGAGEDLAQLIKRLMDVYGVNQSEIARAIGAAPATVNSWMNRTRGGVKGPRAGLLEKLHLAFPKFSREEIFAAASRQIPGDLSDTDEAELRELFSELTAEQQKLTKIQMKAWIASNSQ